MVVAELWRFTARGCISETFFYDVRYINFFSYFQTPVPENDAIVGHRDPDPARRLHLLSRTHVTNLVYLLW